ncbi:unnamed protein product [Spodoptera exigua]|nr:unnamed protein product [Spodoptera exigua]
MWVDTGGDLISKQAVLCHRVLRLARALGASGQLGPRDWKQLLLLLLAAASALLSPPAPHHSAAEQLCERVLCVLFEVWILACHRCFPVPPLWRTLREQCVRWRHRAPLTEQWTRASLALTARLLKHMYGPLFPVMPISEEDANLIPPDMSAEAVMQSWYRILHTIGNPVDLCRPHVISQTPDFLQYSITQDEGSRDPSQHPCLQALPSIFHKAMKGIAAHVDAFLVRVSGGVGRGSERWWGAGSAAGAAPEPEDGDLTPPAHRRLAKSFSVSASRPRDKLPERMGESEKPPLTPLRPKVNSILHLFGEWLFEAALIGTTPQYNNQQRTEGTPPPPSLSDATYKLNMLSYQPGRAEALGTLCRVLCSKQCREEVHPPYLARCYAALHRGLRDPATAAAVVLNAPDIFRLDLDGVLVLVPDFINALDQILSEREPRLECGNIDKRELRKAAISALLSLVAFPYHYKGLPVPEFPGCNEYAGMTLGELTRGRISLICVSAVQTETVDALAVPLLSALYLCVRHNAAAAPAPPAAPSSASHTTDYKEAIERKRAVRWICDYITVQCSRPPQAHSRDLHSCVVAAYSCLAAWLCPALLADQDCIATLLEVVELGISGRKPGEPPKMKDEKELKPVSMRVRDAAESLLMLILEQQIGNGGNGSSWCRLDERWLSALGHGRLRHFVADGNILLSLLEEPLSNSQEPQPTLIAFMNKSIKIYIIDIDDLPSFKWNINGCVQGSPSRLVALDDTAPGFAAALRRLDACGARACVTVHVFCARAGQRSAAQIVANARSRATVPPAFIRMLQGLGTPVRVRGHPGWAGHVDTSYDAPPQPASQPLGEPAPAMYDAREQVLYWSDSTNEIAFVVPSGRESMDSEDRNDSIKSDVDGSCLSNRSEKGAGSCWDVSSGGSVGGYERSVSESERGERGKLGDKLRALSLDLDKQPAAHLAGSGRRNRDYTTKILIIWLEDYEDHLNLPIDELLSYCETGLPWRRHEVCVVCVSARRCGLVRVQCAGGAGGAGAGAGGGGGAANGVLADGALLAPRLLPATLRRAAIDAARRTRLNTDLYQPPHVRRRHLIQELAQQYKKDLTEPELLESLFRNP